ncbi:MAG TPA: hypothetical protein VG738_10195 [Chitinophagaceae bacterium]|nr:hypothetical protein [Chitinophagaceae bacterium]
MFDPEEIPDLKNSIRDCAHSDRKLLDDLLQEVKLIKTTVKTIKPRTTTSISLVASDGGNNKLVYDPFYFQLVRVVDSNGSKLCLDIVSPTTDTDVLSKRQFNSDGSPKTKLGRLMNDLNCETLNDISTMIPKGEVVRQHPDLVSPSWVLTYRDLCEWAVLYDKICYTRFSTNTLIVRDGLLRSKLFSQDLFVQMMEKIIMSINRAYDQDKVRVFLVGLAKHSQVLSRYALVMHLEDVFPKGEPRFAKIDKEIERKSYTWKEFIRKDKEDIEEGGEKNKFSMGDMYLVRFGKMTGDPVWAVDLLFNQSNNDIEIFGYLLADAINGFPVPFYPLCLQKAHEHAQVVDFDMDILQNEVIDAIKGLLPSNKKSIIDEQVFNSDKSQNRYS